MDMRKRLLSFAAASALLFGIAATLPGSSAGIGAVINAAAEDTVYDHSYPKLVSGIELTRDIDFTAEGTSGKVRIDTAGIYIYDEVQNQHLNSTEGMVYEDIDTLSFRTGYSTTLGLSKNGVDKYYIYDHSNIENFMLKYDAASDLWVLSYVHDSTKTSVEYEESIRYTVTIPAKVDLGDTAEVKIEDVCLPPDEKVKVSITETSDDENAYKLKLNGGTDTIDYAIRKLDEEDTQTGDLSIGDYFLSAETDDEVSQKLLFDGPLTEPNYVGTYSGTVTFNVSVFSNIYVGFTEGMYYPISYAYGMTWEEIASIPENSLQIDGEYVRRMYYGKNCKIAKRTQVNGQSVTSAVKTTETIITDGSAYYYIDYNLEHEVYNDVTITDGETEYKYKYPAGLSMTWYELKSLDENYYVPVQIHELYVTIYDGSNYKYFRVLKNGTEPVRSDEVIDPEQQYTVDRSKTYGEFGYPQKETIFASSDGSSCVSFAYTSDTATWKDIADLPENPGFTIDSDGYVEVLFKGAYHKVVQRTSVNYEYVYTRIKGTESFDRWNSYVIDDLDEN